MKQFINIHIGQAGIETGKQVWELYRQEHRISLDGTLENIDEPHFGFNDGLFERKSREKYVPRAIFVDSDPEEICNLRNGKFKNFFPKSNVIGGTDGATIFVRGLNNEIKDRILNCVRRSAEACDNLGGFVLFHSMGGGTGSGISSFLMECLPMFCKNGYNTEFSIYPSPKLSSDIVEPYNVVLNMDYSIDYSNCSYMMDNEALRKICTDVLGKDKPTFLTINKIFARVVSVVTAPTRGNSQSNLTDLQQSVTPYPRVHFPLITYAPIQSIDEMPKKPITVRQLVDHCYYGRYDMVKCRAGIRKYFTFNVICRGETIDREELVAALNEKKPRFVQWCPANFKICINRCRPLVKMENNVADTDVDLCQLGNTKAITDAWSKVNSKFDAMFKKRAFLHWFVNEGMEIDDFLKARINLAALECDYNEFDDDYVAI